MFYWSITTNENSAGKLGMRIAFVRILISFYILSNSAILVIYSFWRKWFLKIHNIKHSLFIKIHYKILVQTHSEENNLKILYYHNRLTYRIPWRMFFQWTHFENNEDIQTFWCHLSRKEYQKRELCNWEKL